MPMNDVTAKPTGIVRSWGKNASDGFRAKRAKSGSLTINVAKLAGACQYIIVRNLLRADVPMADMMPRTMSQPSSEPRTVPDCLTMGPSPFARTIAQMKNAMPAVGTKYALTVNRCRILCTGGQMKGRLPSQNRKKLVNATVFVPEFGMLFLIPPYSSACNVNTLLRLEILDNVHRASYSISSES